MNRLSTICTVLGLLLLAAALCLTAYNVFSDRQASDYADEALRQLQAAATALPALTAEAQPTVDPAATDAADVNAPMTNATETHSTALRQTDAVPTDAQPVTSLAPQTTASGDCAAPVHTGTPDYIIDPARDMPTKNVYGEKYLGVLEIPALSLKLPVMDEWSYKRLRKSPCRYTGSAYLDDMVIMAHNYSSHFGRINALSPGDSVFFTDVDGNAFKYRVLDVETLGSKAVGDMLSGDWDLTLFTCTIGGEYRVTVRCKRVT